MKLFFGIMVPFIGTALGAATVLVMKKEIGRRFQKLLLGFASGVMLAASVWSLLIPSINQSELNGGIKSLPAAVGFLLGIAFLLLLDTIIPHLHRHAEKAEGVKKSKATKNAMLLFAVTLHNIPEGIATGVVFAGMLAGNNDIGISYTSAFVLALGIAIQNFPEGAIVSMPLKNDKTSKGKAFLLGAMSGVVEPIATVLTILMTDMVIPIFPYLLSFAAGAMIYVVVEELIPDLQEGGHSNIGILGLSLGFVLMMILDVELG